jgi:hypothetical protein
MKRIVLLFVVVLLCLTSACSYKTKTAQPLVAVYQHSVETETQSSIVYLVLKQGSYQISDSIGGVLWEGGFKMGGDQLVFTIEQSGKVAKAACPSDEGFSYRWTYDDQAKELTLTTAEDACAYRVQLMTAQAWKVLKVESQPKTETEAAPKE